MTDQSPLPEAPPPPAPELPTTPLTGGKRLRRRHVALVPGETVPILPLDLPPGVRGVARERVAQRQLTDLMGAQADTLQMRPVALKGQEDRWDRVMVTEAGQLATWRGQAARRCQAVLPDYLALPVSDRGWTIAHEDGRVRVRFGRSDGASTTEPALCLQAARLLETDQRPDTILRFGPPLPAFEAQMAEAGIPVTVDAKAAKGLTAFGHGELALDLRADPQAARSRLRRQVGAWRWPVLIGAVAAGLWAAAQLTVIRAAEQETAAITARTLEQVRDNFVPSGPILDTRVQVARALADSRANLRAASDTLSPLDLFASAAPVIAAAGAAPQNVTWEPATGLRLVLILPDFAAVDALVDALGAEALRVTVNEARLSETAGDGVRAELSVTLPEQGG
ncbi:hypothetical protein [Antarctobacter jejuensis]|uniref:hypothetical protein n=1 Tax=Antarctobacter jejuensis TaxID=1439938 RepID=UPI003FD43678